MVNGVSLWEAIRNWAGKLGLAGMVGWLAKTFWSSYQKRMDRARMLVDQARPDLEPLGWQGSNWSGRVRMRNKGTGTAHDMRLTLSHCLGHASGGEIQPGEEGLTAELYFKDQPFFQERQEGAAGLTIIYADRFGNTYKTIIPVGQHQRADGRFNMDVQWHDYRVERPNIRRQDLWKIGSQH